MERWRFVVGSGTVGHARPFLEGTALVSDSQKPDSQKVFDQRSLTTSTGSIWLVVGGAMTLLCGALLFAMQWLRPPGIGFVGFVAVLVLYAAMVVIRYTVRRKRRRLAVLAILTLLIVAVFFVCGGIVTVTEWSNVGGR
jgi:multisubunit Na+/H+ antiporter MnhB subunit